MSISAAGQIGGEHRVSRAQADRGERGAPGGRRPWHDGSRRLGDIGAAAYQCDLYSALTGTAPVAPAKGVLLLASDPLVLGVGGTSLAASHATGAWISETAWGPASGNPGNQGGPFQATGGGFSQLFARPAYQADVPGIGATRGVPDVSADASDRTGVAVVFSSGCSYWRQAYPRGTCVICSREVAVNPVGACHLCWRQAVRSAATAAGPASRRPTGAGSSCTAPTCSGTRRRRPVARAATGFPCAHPGSRWSPIASSRCSK